MRVRIRFFVRYLMLMTFAAATVGCGGNGETGSGTLPNQSESTAKTQVKLMLNWYPEAEHGGYYAALVHGYYAEAGLDVEIVPGGPNAPVIPQTARGAVQFGVTNADRVILARAEGANLKALMAPLQNSPRCVLVHADSPFTEVSELKDVTLMMRRENPWAQFLLSKLPENAVTVAPNTSSLAPFLKDSKSAKQGYVISEPFVAEREGAKVRALMVAEIGFNPYTSVLTTADSYEKENSEVVRKVVQASLRGWKKYLEDAKETNKHIHELNPEMSLDVLSFGVDALKQYCLDENNGEALGRMSSQRWEQLVDQLVSLKLVDQDAVTAESAFSVEYLEERPN